MFSVLPSPKQARASLAVARLTQSAAAPLPISLARVGGSVARLKHCGARTPAQKLSRSQPAPSSTPSLSAHASSSARRGAIVARPSATATPPVSRPKAIPAIAAAAPLRTQAKKMWRQNAKRPALGGGGGGGGGAAPPAATAHGASSMRQTRFRRPAGRRRAGEHRRAQAGRLRILSAARAACPTATAPETSIETYEVHWRSLSGPHRRKPGDLQRTLSKAAEDGQASTDANVTALAAAVDHQL